MVRHRVGTVQNTWESSASAKISVVTFGSPAMMFLEAPGTTAETRNDLRKNVHHIINPDDFIPFSANCLLRKTSRIINKAEETITKILKASWSGAELAVWAAFKVLRIWGNSNDSFAHYGSLYVLYPYEGESSRTRQCALITARKQIPSLPSSELAHVLRFHSVNHYYNCMSEAFDWYQDSHDLVAPQRTSLLDFQKDCLEPFSITECEGIVHEDRVMITANIEPLIAQFFIKGVSCIPRDNIRVSVTHFDFSNTPSSNQVSRVHCARDRSYFTAIDRTNAFTQIQIQITQLMNAADSAKTFSEKVDAMQDLRIRDSFDGIKPLHIAEMKHVSMQDVSLTTTFESIRHAMIVALADQMERVHEFKFQSFNENTTPGSEVDLERAQASRTLTEKARTVVELVDALVRNASPHLVIAKFQDALQMVNELWETDSSNNPSVNDKEVGMHMADSLAVDVPNLTDYIPSNCSKDLRNLILRFLESFKATGIKGPFTEENWTSQKQPQLDKSYIPSLARTLEGFGAELYARMHITDPDKRIELAIEQVAKVLAVMRFCHLIIITQLDVPDGWCLKMYKDHAMKPAGALASLAAGGYTVYSTAGWVLPMSVMTGWGLVASAVGLAAGLASFVGLFTIVEKLPYGQRHYEERNFCDLLTLSVQALGGKSHSSGNLEAALTTLFSQRPKEVRENLQYWQERLATGLKNFRPGFHFLPTLFWAKWLRDVALVGHLRTLVSDRVYIGLEGPTAAGKSSLLTTLTASPPEIFRAGAGTSNRTMDLQSYSPSGLNTVFNDVPGCDDEEPHIREMARLFRDIMSIIIFVVPYHNVRSQGTTAIFKEIAQFIRQRERPRPFRILLTQVDNMDFDEEQTDEFRDHLVELKAVAVAKIMKLGKFPANYTIRTRQAVRGGIKLGNERIEDVVYPFSTFAQMSKTKRKALSDCDASAKPKIQDTDKFSTLYQLAESDVMWDIESLRGWLRGLVPNSVPNTKGRIPPR